jgi:hypothetical protein
MPIREVKERVVKFIRRTPTITGPIYLDPGALNGGNVSPDPPQFKTPAEAIEYLQEYLR